MEGPEGLQSEIGSGESGASGDPRLRVTWAILSDPVRHSASAGKRPPSLSPALACRPGPALPGDQESSTLGLGQLRSQQPGLASPLPPLRRELRSPATSGTACAAVYANRRDGSQQALRGWWVRAGRGEGEV